MSSETAEAAAARAPYDGNDFDADTTEYVRAQKSRFRFKSTKRRPRDSEDLRSSSKTEDYRHRYHHRKKRRRQSESRGDSAVNEGTDLPYASAEQDLDHDKAFRESLFDAMADDEGAEFWEGVYGQPIPKAPPVKQGPTGELEAMTEDEYATYVRAEMYKKTHQYLLEERQRREQAKKERGRILEQAHREEAAAEQFKRMVDESLQKGRERKERVQRASQWAERWSDYENIWGELEGRTKQGAAKIPWPVWRGIREDIGKEEIARFYLNGPTSGNPEQADLVKTLKSERVRWHPDKMQQKLGGLGVDEVEMRAITAVFQIIDRMWREVRDNKA